MNGVNISVYIDILYKKNLPDVKLGGTRIIGAVSFRAAKSISPSSRLVLTSICDFLRGSGALPPAYLSSLFEATAQQAHEDDASLF